VGPDNVSSGVWLPESVSTALPRLDLSPPSRWRVFLALVLDAAKRETDVAELAVADLVHTTALAPRTVKAALADLRARGLVERVGRYRRLRIRLPRIDQSLGCPNVSGNASANRTFTARQAALVETVISEASTLLGTDAGQLTMRHPGSIGLSPPVTYGEAFERLKAGASGPQLSAYVRAVLALVRSEQVQGIDLT
jgi:hypothetical protein